MPRSRTTGFGGVGARDRRSTIFAAPRRPGGRLRLAAPRCNDSSVCSPPVLHRLTLPWWRDAVSSAVRVEPLNEAPGDVEYRWDTDTDILTANLRVRASSEGASGSVEIEGTDGSWLILDLGGGSIQGVEVAV